jgi:hypothetical protein
MVNMMQKILKPLLAVVIVAVAAVAYATGVSCPIDEQNMYFTGKTKTEMGKMLYEYKCSSGHIAWVVQ